MIKSRAIIVAQRAKKTFKKIEKIAKNENLEEIQPILEKVKPRELKTIKKLAQNKLGIKL